MDLAQQPGVVAQTISLRIVISQLPGRELLAHQPGNDAPVPWLSRNDRSADVPESVAGDSQATCSHHYYTTLCTQIVRMGCLHGLLQISFFESPVAISPGSSLPLLGLS